jgi:hypothetical protein
MYKKVESMAVQLGVGINKVTTFFLEPVPGIFCPTF